MQAIGATQEAFMRTITIALAVLFLSSLAAHAEGSWCARYSGRGGGSNCGFHSFEQCRATVSGIGGACTPNSFNAYAAAPRWRYRRGY
jgi:hypothetical protein